MEDHQYFPFERLPALCKQKIFSYLNAVDKGHSAQVCSSWRYLISSSVWDTIDLSSDIGFGCLPSTKHSVEGKECHQCYCKRVSDFFKYLNRIQPNIRRLDFYFDIGDINNNSINYLENIQHGLSSSLCKQLRYVRVNWKDSQDRWLDPGHQPDQNAVYSYRMHLRKFTHFFEHFTTVVPSLTTLILPFDWNQKTILCLAKLRKLESLVLKRVDCSQSIKQSDLDVFSNLPSLKRLLLEVWLPSGDGLIPYTLKSKSLENLDISESHGLYVNQVDMPNLKGIRIARHILHGPLKNFNRLNLPCLHSVLSNGAPKLTKINDHYLQANWRQEIYVTLEEVLRAVCSCPIHLTDLVV
ncbi:uncharacterized protein LOC115218119 [Argonauta hians]